MKGSFRLNRLKKIRNIYQSVGADGVFIYSPENRRYLSRFTGTTGYLVIGNEEAGFITDSRYTNQASEQCTGFEIIENKLNLADYLADTINRYGIKKIAYEDSYMTIKFYNDLKEKLEGIEFIPLKDAEGQIRIIKDQEELENIEKAAEIADKAFTHILDFVKVGAKEKELALELEFFMRKNGATGLSFESILASGWRSALPHGAASDKRIEPNDFVVFDFGCVYNGYCSDMTRTVVVGKVSEKQKNIYNTVLKAQKEALRYIKPGALCKDIDKVARDIIKDAGYGEYFGHGLGHGVGLAIHEEPRLSPIGEVTLEENMVVTDEPGIYIPGFGGVRIEDLVAVGKDGPIIYSKTTKDLIEL